MSNLTHCPSCGQELPVRLHVDCGARINFCDGKAATYCIGARGHEGPHTPPPGLLNEEEMKSLGYEIGGKK